jgi:hypothetical protein
MAEKAVEEFNEAEDFRIDLAKPVEMEAKGKPIRVWLGPDPIDFPQVSQWPLEATEELNEGHVLSALEMIFPEKPKKGPDIVEVARRLPIGVVQDMFDHIQEKSGVTSGESRRSAGSSRSERRKSKRT